MKRLSFLFAVSSIAAVSLLSGCTKDKTTDPVPAPTITASFPNNPAKSVSAAAGSAVVLSYTASAGEGIEEINIVTSFTSATGGSTTGVVKNYPKKSNFKSATADDAIVTDFSSPSSGLVTITFTVKDKKGQVSSAMLYLNQPLGLPELTGGIYSNIWGPSSSAFDFDSKKSVSSTDVSGDIVSAEPTGDAATFSGTFKASNGADVRKSTAAVYNSATSASLAEAFGNSSSLAVYLPEVGDVFIVKYSSSLYAAMKITKITDDGAGTGSTVKNGDSVEFTYKK